MKSRIVGKYKGSLPGPLLIITAGMHGNEPAGVKALETVFAMMEQEPIVNPDFEYKGEIIGLVGNLQAYNAKTRYIEKDINRCWHKEYIDDIRERDISELHGEEVEIREILTIIEKEITNLRPSHVYLLDLHTTSSKGGIFAITTNQSESIRIAHELHVPVILGLLDGIKGTTLHYFTEANLGLPTVSIAFEGGQHENPVSVQRCVAATINFMRSIGTVDAYHVENKHDAILQQYAANLPSVVRVMYKYHIDDNALWEMKEGYVNFQCVQKGEHLATYAGVPVLCPMDGMILMPLYQPQGEDGFFIVEEVGM